MSDGNATEKTEAGETTEVSQQVMGMDTEVKGGWVLFHLKLPAPGGDPAMDMNVTVAGVKEKFLEAANTGDPGCRDALVDAMARITSGYITAHLRKAGLSDVGVKVEKVVPPDPEAQPPAG